MQKHSILLNPLISLPDSPTDSKLVFVNGYQVNVQSIGGGVVNATNVRSFLNDDRNGFMINDFFSFLTGNTNSVEFQTIFYSDEKLSNVFNEYYNTAILSGTQTTTSIINQSLTGSTGTTYYNNYFNWDGFSPIVPMSGSPVHIMNSTRDIIQQVDLSSYSTEKSYYIDVFITQSFRQTARSNYEELFPEILNKMILSSYTDSNLFSTINGITQNDGIISGSSFISNLINDFH